MTPKPQNSKLIENFSKSLTENTDNHTKCVSCVSSRWLDGVMGQGIQFLELKQKEVYIFGKYAWLKMKNIFIFGKYALKKMFGNFGKCFESFQKMEIEWLAREE